MSPVGVESNETIGAAFVKRVEILGLHGVYDYDLSFDHVDGVRRLTLLYGDNGSGKTTILRLLWDVLSPSNDNDHRKRIAETAFQRMVIHLGNSRRLVLERTLAVAGPYTIEVRSKSRVQSISSWPEKGRFDEYFDGWDLKDFELRLDSFSPQEDEIRESGRRVLAKKEYISFLESLGSAPYFLADDRSTASDEFAKDLVDRDIRRSPARTSALRSDDSARIVSRRLAHELEISIRRANLMLQQKTLGGTASGSANANSVYLDVVKQIGAPASTAAVDPRRERAELVEEIERVGNRSLDFEKYELTPRFVSARFADAVRALDDSRVDVAAAVLRPFLESLTVRLNGLGEAQHLIDTFLQEANSFLQGKELSYSQRFGLRIRLDSGEELRPDQLSSGECHIVLLLSNALLAREGSKLFLIDEPELSLNVKWQRRVVSALLACTEGSEVQFVIATHSIELLSAFRPNVVRMSSKDESED